MENQVRAICRKEGLPAREITRLNGGQVNHVFLVDGQFVVRVGQREDAFQRLKCETERLHALAGKIPVPKVLAFGMLDGQEVLDGPNGLVYQIQQFIPGQKLISVWNHLHPEQQERIVAELAGYLKILHSSVYPDYGYARPDTPRFTSWEDYLTDKLNQTLAEIKGLNLRMAPGIVELAESYFSQQKHVLSAGVPTLVHGDLSLVNLLVDNGRISAILDFEYSLHAPRDYELWVMEAFCLYPNDYAEEDQEIFCSADFAGFIPLLRKQDPALFDFPFLRERVDLYHLEATLSGYLAWRKDHLDTIPPDQMAAKNFYLARISNFTFKHGIRLF